MTQEESVDFAAIRLGMNNFDLSIRVEPNDEIPLARAFLPDSHRGVLDMQRSLVIGNRGAGKSFWTHALLNDEFRQKLAEVYGFTAFGRSTVCIGFNGSDKTALVAPTPDEIAAALADGIDPDTIWRAVLLRGVRSIERPGQVKTFRDSLRESGSNIELYSQEMSELDVRLEKEGRTLLFVFDALDRLGSNWDDIRELTKTLLSRILRLQSFRSIRAKAFMRVDQFGDDQLFRFQDSSKIKNSAVDLKWDPEDLYSLLLFELLRIQESGEALRDLARRTGTELALPHDGRMSALARQPLDMLISALAGEFMGSHKKRGRVFTWVPLHLSDAENTCSPRTFLKAWGAAAAHRPPPEDKAVDHLGLSEGVRQASRDRLVELREDYPWIDPALDALRGQFVPIERDQLFKLWLDADVLKNILKNAVSEPTKAPVGLQRSDEPEHLLEALRRIAVIEVRANGRINVPDIFRVEAGIKRKGGVAVPRPLG